MCALALQIPEIEGPLWLKSEGKKSWKKYYFVLRPNGLYRATKPGGKVASARYNIVLISRIVINK